MEFLRRLFETDFMPHGHCYFWKPAVLWTNVLGDGAIALSYYIIPFLLLRFLKQREDIKFRGIFVAFAAFILACGTTHVIDIVSVWYPMYRLEGLVKVITAIISTTTVGMLFYYFPTVLNMPTGEQFSEAKGAAINSSRRFKLLMAHAPVGIVITDYTGDFLEVNDAMCNLFMRSRAELLNLKSNDVTHPDDLEITNSVKERLSGEVNNFVQLEKRYIRGDGSYFWAMVNATAIPEEKCILVHITDITIRKQSELRIKNDNEKLESKVAESTSELRETNRDLENFIYAVTHDLRVPLHNLQGLSAVVEEELIDYKEKEEAITAVKMIGENALKMDNLLTDLLAFSKTGKLEITKKEVNMQEIVKAVFEEVGTFNNKMKIDFQIGSLPNAFGDPAALKLVWQNLIGNAIKYTSRKEEMRIQISGKEENGIAIFQIADNGIGFNPQYASKLFQPFQRLHHAEEFEGTGIGLATSQRIIQKHGGKMWAIGTPGEGAVFYFSLPMRDNPAK